MLETATDGRIAFLFFVVAGIAAYIGAHLAGSRTRIRLRFRARCVLVFLGSALLLLVLRFVALGQLWFVDRPGAADRLAAAVVLVAVPAAAVLVRSVPRIWRVTCGVVADPWGPTEATIRAEASAPGVVVPVQAMALGAALAPFRSLFPQQFPPLAVTAVLAVVLAMLTMILWMWQRRRSELFSAPSLSYAEEIRLRRALEIRRTAP